MRRYLDGVLECVSLMLVDVIRKLVVLLLIIISVAELIYGTTDHFNYRHYGYLITEISTTTIIYSHLQGWILLAC